MAAGGGGEGAEEGGRERGGRLPPASVRRGSALAPEGKQSPALPPRPLLLLLSQQRGVRHRVALRRRVTALDVVAPRPAAPAWSAGRPHGPGWPRECGALRRGGNRRLGSGCGRCLGRHQRTVYWRRLWPPGHRGGRWVAGGSTWATQVVVFAAGHGDPAPRAVRGGRLPSHRAGETLPARPGVISGRPRLFS